MGTTTVIEASNAHLRGVSVELSGDVSQTAWCRRISGAQTLDDLTSAVEAALPEAAGLKKLLDYLKDPKRTEKIVRCGVTVEQQLSN
jgi:hypothetical protein